MWELSRAGVLMSGTTAMPRQSPPHALHGDGYRVPPSCLAANHSPRFALR
jgi:hypothetical protein